MSWSELEPVVRAVAPEVREAVRQVVDAVDYRRRREAIRLLGARLGQNASGFALALLDEPLRSARVIGLELVGRLRRPPLDVRRAVRRQLPDRSLVLSARTSAARALFRVCGNSIARATKLLRCFAAGLGRAHAVDRFERVVAKLKCPEAAIATVRAELLDRQRLRCPRCGAMRRRRRMIQHLWKHHRLLLEGRRARTTWQVLDDRIVDGDAMIGLGELHRTILQCGVQDDESLAHLLAAAAKQHESLCPHCFAAVPLLEAPLPLPMETSPGRVAGSGFVVAIEERTGRQFLRVEMPRNVLWNGPEPGVWPTARIFYYLAVVVAALATLAAALLPPPWHLFTAAALLGETCLLLTLAKRATDRLGDPLDRAIDHAWVQLTPQLSADEATSRLALASVGRGDPSRRSAELERLISESIRDGLTNNLVPLLWLHAADGGTFGNDSLQQITTRMKDCFAGRLPMICIADLLTLAYTGLRMRGQRARLRVLACEAAFSEQLTVGDLNELGRLFPVLARMMGTEDIDHLARLRWVWEQQASRPWRQCGPAATVFELARYPMLGGQVLAAEPDLLLYQPVPPVGPREEPAAVSVVGRGIVFRDALVREMPEHIWVWNRPDWRGGGYELRLGLHRFFYQDDPSELAQRLRHWAEFALQDFLPQAGQVLRYRVSSDLAARLNSRWVKCSSCGKDVVPVAGRIGAAR